MKLHSLRLINYEGHTNTFIKFHKGTNVIVGDNLKGKSSIFYGYRWLCTNRPRGRDFITTGQSFCSVKADYGNYTIERILSKTKNEYRIKFKDSTKSLRFKKIKDQVPDEVKKLLMYDEHTFQDQGDSTFLVLQPASKIGDVINNIIGIDDVQLVTTEIGKKIRNTNEKIEDVQSEIQDIISELQDAEFNKIKKLTTQTNKATQLVKLRTKTDEDLDILCSIMQDINGTDRSLNNLKGFEQITKPAIDKMSSLAKELTLTIDKLDILDDLIDDLFSVEETLTKFKSQNQYQSLIETCENQLNSILLYLKDMDELSLIDERVNLMISEIAEDEEELHLIIKRVGDVCPVCGNKMGN